jgi:hypothetical protein
MLLEVVRCLARQFFSIRDAFSLAVDSRFSHWQQGIKKKKKKNLCSQWLTHHE